MFVRNGAVTPGPSRECDITFFVKGRPKSARQSRDSTVVARRVQSVTVLSSWVSRECRFPGLRSPPLKRPEDRQTKLDQIRHKKKWQNGCQKVAETGKGDLSYPPLNLTRRGGAYIGKTGSICRFSSALPASIWGNCSQILVSFLGFGVHTRRGVTMRLFVLLFLASGYRGTGNLYITAIIFPGISFGVNFGIALHSLYRKYFSAEIILLYITLSWPQPLSCTSFCFHYITLKFRKQINFAIHYIMVTLKLFSEF